MSSARALASMHRQHDMRRETRKQSAQVVGAKGDASFGRREVGTSAMQKDRAAAAFAARSIVVVEDDDEVVKAVVAPQSLVRPRTWRRDEPVIDGARRIVAPSEPGARGDERQQGPRPAPVRPEKTEQKREGTYGTRMISLALGRFQSAGSERAGQDGDTGTQPADRELSLSRWRCAARYHKTGQSRARRSVCGTEDREAFSCWKFHSDTGSFHIHPVRDALRFGAGPRRVEHRDPSFDRLSKSTPSRNLPA